MTSGPVMLMLIMDYFWSTMPSLLRGGRARPFTH